MLTGTPFHSRTSPLCQAQNWRRWGGHLVVSSYELLPDREYWAIRNSAALIDVSPLYKYRVSGPDALRLLNRVVTRDLSKLAVGQVAYTPWCDEHGKVIDDGTIARLDDQIFRLTSAEPNYRWLCDNAMGLNVTIEDVSSRTASLALQGPRSREILKAASSGADLDRLKYYRLVRADIGGCPVEISRTGYTGDLGYEIWIEAKHAESIWDTLVSKGNGYGLTPAGIWALDVARIEAGLIMLDVDYVSARRATIEAQKSSPFEIGLGWAVNLDKPNFIGRKALMKEKEQGSTWQFVGVEVEWDSLERLYNDVGLPPQLPTIAFRASVPIFSAGRQVGYASSGCWSPILKKYIALAHVESAHAKPGALVTMEVTVEHRRKFATAHVAKMPFFNPERKRA
ncbi:MAG: aminomethyl transferase family protein [Chloroflexi bacterium]|nr:aminomethyl transferase family protein [Chloroflexota bacterium]